MGVGDLMTEFYLLRNENGSDFQGREGKHIITGMTLESNELTHKTEYSRSVKMSGAN